MSLASWGQEVLDAEEARTGSGRISMGKSRKGGEEHEATTVTLRNRRLYELQTLLETLLEDQGTAAEKLAVSLILNDIRLAVAKARKEEERRALLRRHGLKASDFGVTPSGSA